MNFFVQVYQNSNGKGWIINYCEVFSKKGTIGAAYLLLFHFESVFNAQIKMEDYDSTAISTHRIICHVATVTSSIKLRTYYTAKYSFDDQIHLRQ